MVYDSYLEQLIKSFHQIYPTIGQINNVLQKTAKTFFICVSPGRKGKRLFITALQQPGKVNKRA